MRDCLAFLLLLPALASGQAVPPTATLGHQAGSYVLTVPDTSRITFVGKAITIEPADTPPPIPPPTPTPTPDPPPIPPPGPTPAVGVLHVTAVFDTDALTIEQAKIRGSLTISAALKALNAIWRTYEVKSPDLDRLALRATVQATGLPSLIVQSADGKLVRAVKLTTEADTVALVKGLR